MNGNVFDEFPEVFDAMIDWPRRLANEGPFYRQLFDRLGARRVLEVACGTGAHAAMFHGWGLQAEAADSSPAMLHLARQRHGAPDGLRWVQRRFEEPVNNGPFDAAICVGNSLALSGNPQTAQQVIQRMLHALRPSGAAVVHVLNLWSLPLGPCTWHKSLRCSLSIGEVMILRGVHRSPEAACVEVLVLDVASGARLFSQAVPLLMLTRD